MRREAKVIERPLRQAHDAHPLDVLFEPKSVALFGASEREGSVGRSLVRNLIDGSFAGDIYPINPKRNTVFELPAYPDIEHTPSVPDLAVIATPAPTVPAIVRSCLAVGVKGAIILSAGFKEIGPEGQALEDEIRSAIEGTDFRIIGPNCLGLMRPAAKFNATFANGMALPGSAALISQSGALCTAILDWSRKVNVGFSAFVSIGSMLDVNWGDLIDFLGSDDRTHSILMYMESIGDVRAFLSAAREVSLTKPIIVLKAGRTAEAAQAAVSHTGALAGSDDVLDAAFERCGVLRVDTIAELFYMAEVLVKQPRPRGPRLAVLTNAGGPGVLATDALIRVGGELAHLSDETMQALNEILPPQWSHNNPVDVLGDAGAVRYADALRIVSADPNTDGVLAILTPQAMTDPTAIASELARQAASAKKPVLASWMGGSQVAEGELILNEHQVPTFPYPDTAARIFRFMWRYSENLQNLYATPPPVTGSREDPPNRERVKELIADVRKAGRNLMTEVESKELLTAYGIPTVPTVLAQSEVEALAAARRIGYPVALKLYSETITHKTDVGGVALSLKDDAAVRGAFESIRNSVSEKVGAQHFQGVTVQPMVKHEGYELIFGSSCDPQLGPVLVFGAGGQLVEVNADRALALPPLTVTLALHAIRETRIYKALKGVRGRKPVDLQRLAELLVRFSWLVAEQPDIREIDINPLVASDTTLIALDARVVLGDGCGKQAATRLAIRPYPYEYASEAHLRDGAAVAIRPIRADDEPLLAQFHETLSPESLFFRYFWLPSLSARTAHTRLTRLCSIDYDRQMALVALEQDPHDHSRQIVGVGRLVRQNDRSRAEFAVIVSDSYQRRGVGTVLLQRLIAIARSEGITRITGQLLPENHAMAAVCQKLGFTLHYQPEGAVVIAEIDLESYATK